MIYIIYKVVIHFYKSPYTSFPTTVQMATNETENERSYNSKVSSIIFNPDDYPHDTLKAFNQFVEQFEFRYEAQYPEIPKHIYEMELENWKIDKGVTEVPDKSKVQIRQSSKSKDKVRKLLGFFCSIRMQQDWKAAEPDADKRSGCTWDYFLSKMRAFYKPTENSTIRNFEFRQLVQNTNETFTAFCNRVQRGF